MEHPVPAQLRQLIRKADALSEKADAVVRRAVREIRAELALLAKESEIATSAAAREKAYESVKKRMAKLEKRLSELLRANLRYAGEKAAERAQRETGLRVEYSKKRADEIVALISPDQGENLAAVFTEKMQKRIIGNLRMAVVSAFRENAVAGGKMKDLAKLIDEKWQRAAKDGETYVFTDAGGHIWDTKTYMQMNTRTNAMRVFNDCLVDGIARATGSDLVRVSYGGDPHCSGCKPWEGRILSVTGKTKGYPTYEEAKAAGCFHPNCTHTLQAVDDAVDAGDIDAQKGVPAPDKVDDPLKQAFDIRVEKAKRDGVKDAKMFVMRDILKDAIRNGCPFEGADSAVDGLTDEEVEEIVIDGKAPEFTPTKGREPEAYNQGKNGGVVHIDRDRITADAIRRIMEL